MDQELEGLEKDLIEICNKHGLSSASFTATTKTGSGVSLFSVDNQVVNGHCFDAAMNVGRLWWHVRTQIKAGLDNFEKWV